MESIDCGALFALAAKVARCERAWSVLTGATPADPDAPAIAHVGARNDYNARGRGSTTAWRVLRAGATTWSWLSAPASRGRFLAADRSDEQTGEAYEGDLLVKYTLGGRAAPQPERVRLVSRRGALDLEHRTRRDGSLVVSSPALGEHIVSSPMWRGVP